MDSSQPEQCLDDNLLRSYLDEGALLPAASRDKIKTHLANCQLCQARLAALPLQINRVNQLLEIAIPAPKIDVPDPQAALARWRLRYPRVIVTQTPPKSTAKKPKT